MKFDDLVNQLLNETDASEQRLDKLSRLHKLGTHMSDADSAYVVIHDILKDSNASEDDYIALGKELRDGGMGRDEYSIETLQKALEYARSDGWEFDIEAVLDQIGGPSGESDYQSEYQDDEYEHRGWPGDGSGEDDFADYNQMEGNDY